MNILVTGCEGTVGRKLMAGLKAHGHTVYGIDLKHSKEHNIMRCDISDYRQLESVYLNVDFANCDIVFHLAAEFGRINGEEYYEDVWQTNAIGTRNILEMQRIHGFKLIFASSSEIYGELDTADGFISEDMQPGVLTNDYAISKLVNEMQCANFRRRYSSEIMVLRFFNSYGPGEYYTPYRSVCCLFAYRLLHGLPIEVYRDYHRVFMYVEDFIPTLISACDNFIDGEVVNIGGDEYRSVEELAQITMELTGAEKSLVKYLDSDKHNVKNKRPDITKSIDLFRHNPKTGLEFGMSETVNWMRKVYDV